MSAFTLSLLEDKEIVTISQSEKTKVKVMRDGKDVVTVKNYFGERGLAEIFMEMIDDKLIDIT